jgi:presenilin-like A22 family membrane protease
LKNEPRISPIQLLPVLASLAFGVIFAYVGNMINFSAQVLPFPEGPESILNGLYFVVLAGVGATLIYFLIKRRKMRTISLILGFALTAAIFMLSLFYLSIAFFFSFVTLAVASVLTAVADFLIFRRGGKLANIVILVLGGALGAFLGISPYLLSGVLILAFLAIYDIYAVYRGPVGKIAQHGLDELKGLSFSFKDIQMGLGDLTFYSMLAGMALVDANLIVCLASVVGISAGVLLVLKMVEKRGIFPGLPFPIFLGLLPLFIFYLLKL